MAETKEPQATSHPDFLSPDPPVWKLRFRSVGSVAVLLELWSQGRCVLDKNEVEYLLSRMQSLDMAVANRYDELFVNR